MSNSPIIPGLYAANPPVPAAQPQAPVKGPEQAQAAVSPDRAAGSPSGPVDGLGGQSLPASGRAKPAISLDLPAADPSEPPGRAKQKGDDGWKVRFYFGMNRTKYYNSDIQLRTPNADVTIKGVEWKERTSAAYYNPAEWKTFQNAFQWIDEPTNTFVLSASKGKNEFIFSAFHPKYLTHSDQVREIKGTIDGIAVDGPMPLHGTLVDGERQPGSLYVAGIRNTHMQMDFQLGYGREFELFRTPKNTSMVYRPAIYAGVMMGKTVGSYEETPGNFVEVEDKVRVHGATAAIGNKLELRIRDRVSLMAEYKVSGAMLNQKVFDGTAKYNMLYTPLHFGIGVKLYDQNRHR